MVGLWGRGTFTYAPNPVGRVQPGAGQVGREVTESRSLRLYLHLEDRVFRPHSDEVVVAQHDLLPCAPIKGNPYQQVVAFRRPADLPGSLGSLAPLRGSLRQGQGPAVDNQSIGKFF